MTFMKLIQQLIFILFFVFTQNVRANWVNFYESEIFDARLLLNSVHQDRQKTKVLIVFDFKEKLFSDGVGSHVVFLEHICGEINPVIIEEKFFKGSVNKSEELKIDKFKKYVDIVFPRLVKQICI